ncbi:MULTISPECIES: hypothetical protein [Mycetohabitans]|nr:hypothetical protein [Mycetohabitans sp. B3]MCF2134031.1 hypothetical protein [Mycetohabitans sp. B3]
MTPGDLPPSQFIDLLEQAINDARHNGDRHEVGIQDNVAESEERDW